MYIEEYKQKKYIYIYTYIHTNIDGTKPLIFGRLHDLDHHSGIA